MTQRLHWSAYLLFALLCAGLSVAPIRNQLVQNPPAGWPLFTAPDKPTAGEVDSLTKLGPMDYPNWYVAGRTVVESGNFEGGLPLYLPHEYIGYPFLYPPFAAICLAALSLLGPTGMVISLVISNALSLLFAIEFSLRLAAGAEPIPTAARVIPTLICGFFINDLFLMGQANLGLLALVLGGLLLLRSKREWAAGVPFALAAAIKAFPIVIVLYLLWRRRWKAAASTLLVTIALLVLAPAPIRGWDRNLADLKDWLNGMVFSDANCGHGQRPERSVGWRNQSLFGVGARYFDKTNAKAEEALDDPRRLPGQHVSEEVGSTPTHSLYLNFLQLGPSGAKWATLIAAGLIGLGFILVLPKKSRVTPRSYGLEVGLLIALMTIASPYAYAYYFSWLLMPLTVLCHRAWTDPERTNRRIAWASIVGVAVLFAASAPQIWGKLPMAVGVLFWSAIIAAVGLGVLLKRERAGTVR